MQPNCTPDRACCCAASWPAVLAHCCYVHPPHRLCPWLQGVANRDLKLENLLLDRDCRDGTRPLLKICDFGYSKVTVGSSAGWEQLTVSKMWAAVFCMPAGHASC